MWGGNMMGWGWGWGAGGFFGLLHVLWWVLVIVVIVALVRWIFGGRGRNEEDRALSILRERYAKGEISKEEFESRKRDLAS